MRIISEPTWISIRHHIFKAHIPKKLFKAISGIERLFQRVAKIHIYKTSNDLVQMDFVDPGDRAVKPPHLKYAFRDIQRLYLMVITKDGGKRLIKIPNAILTN